MGSREKILSRDALRARIAEHRQNKMRVVLANGCFDLLHVGHVRYLEAAKREGDVLVVGVNSDSSARPLKGEGRPILGAAARAELVAALAPVDYVVIFPETNAEALLNDLRPDVHAKGTDYTATTVPERERAAQLGVRIAIVGDPKQHSTHDLLARVRESSDDGRGDRGGGVSPGDELKEVPGAAWARWRVPVSYPLALAYFWLARPTPASLALGAVIAAAGLVVRASAAGHLGKGQGLAAEGPYAYTRNPLYLGSALLAGGFCVAAHAWVPAALVTIYFAAFYVAVMHREEQELRAVCGRAFDDYAARVPRFWPRLRRANLESGGPRESFSWATYRRNREYRAVLGFLFALAALGLKLYWGAWFIGGDRLR